MEKKYFGFLVHPRDSEDFYIKYPYFRFLPGIITDFLTKHLPPVVISKITGLKNLRGNPVDGYVIAITITAKQMMENKKLALKKIRSAVLFAKRLGVGILGLGALTASLSRGGLDVSGNGIGITSGRAFTVRNIGNYLIWLEEKFQIEKEKAIVGVVGAAGSIGSSVAKLMRGAGYKKFRLVDLEDKVAGLEHFLSNDHSEDVDVKVSHKMEIIKDADIVIAATNAPEVVIQPEDVKIGAIIINDAQPSDISPRILQERRDVLVLEGGVVKINGLDTKFNFRLKSKNDTFSCMAESMILSASDKFDDFGLGNLNMESVFEIDKMSQNLPGISLSPQNSLSEIRDKYINETIKAGR